MSAEPLCGALGALNEAMTAFQPFLAATADMSLEQTLRALRENSRVESCLLLGSTAGQVSDWSDYDIMVVGFFDEPFSVEFSFVDSRATDVILLSVAEFNRLLDQSSPASPQDCDALSWIAGSNVAFAKDDRLLDAPGLARAVLRSGSVPRGETYMRWVEANHLLLKINRYRPSPSEEYQEGLEFILAKAIAALPQDFLSARGIRWLGDKDGMKTLRQVDEQFAESVLSALRAKDLSEKCSAYAKLSEWAFAPVARMWRIPETAGGWFKIDGPPRTRSLWESLFAA